MMWLNKTLNSPAAAAAPLPNYKSLLWTQVAQLLGGMIHTQKKQTIKAKFIFVYSYFVAS